MPGLGTQLRHLLASLDGGVQDIYDRLGVEFRPRYYPVVRLLLERESAGVGAIATATGVSQPAATQTINEMKKLGLVERASGEDRRQHLLRLTAKGHELAIQLSKAWKAVDRAARQLDEELPCGLELVVASALAALQRQGFADRIFAQMESVE
jgi:MarR family transcriptional regulator, organic hydroperoxide resistance regulator